MILKMSNNCTIYHTNSINIKFLDDDFDYET